MTTTRVDENGTERVSAGRHCLPLLQRRADHTIDRLPSGMKVGWAGLYSCEELTKRVDCSRPDMMLALANVEDFVIGHGSAISLNLLCVDVLLVEMGEESLAAAAEFVKPLFCKLLADQLPKTKRYIKLARSSVYRLQPVRVVNCYNAVSKWACLIATTHLLRSVRQLPAWQPTERFHRMRQVCRARRNSRHRPSV
jgi:hypothetical protein